ncbi:tellurite resistance TerB family protein [Shumkonia mesophila]|uniref:tellurite resistance TerB family protein n=1 Tax=Shumkonia mesophila TaxID=2838854 RepID=UPI002934DFEF|nr:TerB family tellurite resistance protein [Shumkonia mesophila]
MIRRLKAWLLGETVDDDGPDDPLHLAAAALLVEAASLDDDFDDSERRTIAAVLESRFGLAPDEVETLIGRASSAVAESAQLYGFTRTLKDRLQPEERVRVIEMLWEVACADGEVDSYESGLVRRVAGLLFVPDKESGEARQRVLARLDLRPASPN